MSYSCHKESYEQSSGVTRMDRYMQDLHVIKKACNASSLDLRDAIVKSIKTELQKDYRNNSNYSLNV